MESDFDKKVQSKAQELRKLGAKHKKQVAEDEEPVEKKEEVVEKKEEPVERKEETQQPLDVDVAVKSVLGAKLNKKQSDEAADTSPEPETKDNKDLEGKLQQLIKQSKEISKYTQDQK